MKLIYPAGIATEDETKELLELAAESRKRVKDQLMRIDSTYPEVDFSFTSHAGTKVPIMTLEETEYPAYYHKRPISEDVTNDVNPEVIDLEKSKPSEMQRAMPTIITPTEGQGYLLKIRKLLQIMRISESLT